MGKTRRRSKTNSVESDGQGRPVQTPKPKMPSAAANAAAIDVLSEKVTGIDSQLSGITALLTQLTTSMPLQPTTPIDLLSEEQLTPRRATPFAGVDRRAHSACPLRHHRAESGGRQADGPPTVRPRGASLAAATHVPWPGQTRPAHTPQAAVSFTGTAAQPVASIPTTSAWDRATSLTDLDGDALLTRRVAAALQQVANPYTQNKVRWLNSHISWSLGEKRG